MTVKKKLLVELEPDVYSTLREVINNTSESKKDLIARLIKSEHKRMIEQKDVVELLNNRITSIEESMTMFKAGINRMLSSDMFIMKEAYRIINLLQSVFEQNSNINSLNRKQIISDTNRLTNEQFNIFINNIMNNSSGKIEAMLKQD